MTIIVTHHAVERYAERVIGIAPEALTAVLRDRIRAEIARIVEATAMPGQMNWRAKKRDATYIVKNRAVTTVLFPWQKTNRSRIGRLP